MLLYVPSFHKYSTKTFSKKNCETMISSKIFLRKEAVKKDGTAPLYLQVIIDRKKKIYHTEFFVKPENWDGARVKSKHKLSMEINNFLDNFKVKADNTLLQLRKADKPINFDNFESLFLEQTESQTNDFYAYALNYIEAYKKNYTDSSYKMLISEINKLKRFKPTLNFDEVNYDFMSRYEVYMMNTLNNQPNTIAKSFKKIKMIINVALKNGVISVNPVTSFKIKTVPTSRSYLSMEEVKILEDIFHKNEINNHLHNTLQCFLFACYTGLRYDDILNLNYKDISNDYILLIQGKTNTQITIPLIDKAKHLIDQTQHNGRVFTVYTNQKCNEYLKFIMIHANINKRVSFHTARHTFATISLNLGIPIDVVSKLLGHSDLKTTQIYAKLFEKTKFDQMDKWNKM